MSNQNLKKPYAMFFDWDGTLVDSFSFLEQAHNDVLGKFGMPLFEKGGFKQYFGKPREEIYPAIYADRAEEARGLFEDFVINNHKTLLEPMDGAYELLQTIHDLGIKIGVVSNKKSEFVNAEINHLGWRSFLVSVVGAREAEQDKPSPTPLILALKRAEIDGPIEDIWYVGDTIIDQKCAENAGSPFVYINHEGEVGNDILKTEPDVVADNCFALSDFMLQYSGN